MPSTEMLHTWLRRRQTHQGLRHELRPRAVLGRATLYIPRTGRVDAQHRDGAGFDLRDYGREGIAQGPAEREAEYGVYD